MMLHPIRRQRTPGLLLFCFSLAGGCASDKPSPTDAPAGNDSTVIVPVSDPPVAATVGFFLDGWTPKAFAAPAFNEYASPGESTGTVTVDASAVLGRIPAAIFGHNANSWMSRMVDQPAFLNHTTNLRPNIIRFPGGSLSDVYFWNASPSAPPVGVPDVLLDQDGKPLTNPFWYGNVNNGWQASVEDYYETLRLTGSQGLITVNYGYARYGTSSDPVAGAAHLAAEWVRYDKGRTKYWEVGNENFGEWEAGYRIDRSRNRDGQPELISGSLYARHFKVFADSMRKAAQEVGNTIHIGAVLYDSDPASWNTDAIKGWNSGMIAGLGGKNDFYVVHSYVTPYGENSDGATILNAAAAEPGRLMTYSRSVIQKFGGEEKPIALTEWNMWASGSMQQVSNVSGLFAVIIQGEAIRNGFGLTTRWDLLNGWSNGDDHGLFSDGSEPGVQKWTPRPSFYYMYYFQRAMGDRLIPSSSSSPSLKTYASSYSSGQVAVTIVNTAATAQTIQLKFSNFNPGNRMYWYSLEGGSDNGEFSRKVSVNGSSTSAPAGGPTDYVSIPARSARTSDGMRVSVPGRGAAFVLLDKK